MSPTRDITRRSKKEADYGESQAGQKIVVRLYRIMSMPRRRFREAKDHGHDQRRLFEDIADVA
jgi:hypothetical protein